MASKLRSKRAGISTGIERIAAAGEVVVREGDEAEEMFIIRSGRIAITRDIGGRSVQLAELGPGEFFGEMSVLESLPRAADATALEESCLVVVGIGALMVRIRRDPTFAIEMLNKMAGRVRVMHEHLDAALDTADLNEVGDVRLL
jgi:CRP-like cAMP-binding protein